MRIIKGIGFGVMWTVFLLSLFTALGTRFDWFPMNLIVW